MTLNIEMKEVNSGATEYFLVYADKDYFISGVVNKKEYLYRRQGNRLYRTTRFYKRTCRREWKSI